MIIPYCELASETLDAVLESYIQREGTDYGAVEQSLASQLAQLRRQLESGEIVLAFDTASESINLLTREQARSAGLS